MDTINRITAPAGEKFRQLQRIVNDIKKNDGGIIDKLRSLTSNKNPPSVPQRDYFADNADSDDNEEEFDDDSEYEDPDGPSDSETYAVPEDNDDDDDENYEPPPTEPENTLPTPILFGPSNGGYADKKPNRQPPVLPNPIMNKPRPKPNTTPRTNQPLPPQSRAHMTPPSIPKPMSNKLFSIPQLSPRPHPGMKKALPKEQFENQEDYIVPKEEDDDNYIEPTQDIQQPYKPPVVNRASKPTKPTIPSSAKSLSLPIIDPNESAVYEVPENEVKPSPQLKRSSLPLPKRDSPPKIEPDDVEYDICDDHTFVTPSKGPSPLPRINKPKPPSLKTQKPSLPTRDVNSNIDKLTGSNRTWPHSSGSELPPLPHPAMKFPLPVPGPKPPVVQRSLELPNRYPAMPSRNNLPSASEQEAGVVNKEWYASSCPRKTAEDALQSSSRDGSFLIRKSTGQDARQPYTLVVFYNRKVYNIPVRYIESTQQYALGREKSGEERFSSVAEMIENHQRTPLVLIDGQNNTKDSTKLRFPVKIP
ncbi:B-cell linker isoform X4 [Pelobates cultripes]|uniref:B-cell linker isoform X4 n=1 Tax=Pelobates cultripes TaxID=61616 RepID=A0AAD1TAR1_PELCU|nr:B-cell linker isoform X4 [Pelobates cultripes]